MNLDLTHQLDAAHNTFLEQLYFENRNFLFHIALDILHDNYLAEDAIQETFLIALDLNLLDKFSTMSLDNIGAYLTTTIRNVSFDILNHSKKISYVPFADDSLNNSKSTTFNNTDLAIQKNSLEELTLTLKKLQKNYTQILTLKYVNDMSDREIANMLNTTTPNVRKRLERARIKLRTQLKKDHPHYFI